MRMIISRVLIQCAFEIVSCAYTEVCQNIAYNQWHRISYMQAYTRIPYIHQHMYPDRCTFVVDIRSNECYSNQELFAEIQKHISCEAKARSFRLSSSHVEERHPIVQRAVAMGRVPFGSPTLSDQALMSFPSLKMGPGKSSRSHTADEFIFIQEIEEAIGLYLKLLDGAIL